MALTEDDIGKAVRKGTMTIDEVVTAFQGTGVIVYPDMKLTEGQETWEQVEELGSGSTMFAALQTAGATPEQLDEIGTQIVRLRAIGSTMDKVFGWGPGEADNPAPTTEADTIEEGDQPS